MGFFRDRSIQLLIATDVAARGIDVTGITHVINYELPDDVEVYTHRSGRTGRAGNSGVCVSIVTPKETYRLRQIERILNARFTKWIYQPVRMFAGSNSSILLIKC
nr:C-terminal helicase domain-containing protein [Candidatus Brachybacter algidus]